MSSNCREIVSCVFMVTMIACAVLAVIVIKAKPLEVVQAAHEAYVLSFDVQSAGDLNELAAVHEVWLRSRSSTVLRRIPVNNEEGNLYDDNVRQFYCRYIHQYWTLRKAAMAVESRKMAAHADRLIAELTEADTYDDAEFMYLKVQADITLQKYEMNLRTSTEEMKLARTLVMLTKTWDNQENYEPRTIPSKDIENELVKQAKYMLTKAYCIRAYELILSDPGPKIAEVLAEKSDDGVNLLRESASQLIREEMKKYATKTF